MESCGLVVVPDRSTTVLPVGSGAVKEEPKERGSMVGGSKKSPAKDGLVVGGGGGGEGTGAGGSKQKQKSESQLILVMEPQNPSPTKYFDQNGIPLKKEETAGSEQVKVAAKSKRTKLTITCHKCRRMFETKIEFEFHYRKAYNQEPVYACGQCDKQILQYKAYRLHCYRHSNSATQRYTCAVCAKVFHQKSDLTRHEAIHETAATPTASKQSESERVPIGCERCDAVFGSQAEVRVHVRKIHPVPKQMIECPDCGKFLSAGSLYSHRKIHSVDGPRFRCEDCDKSFVQKINFIHHRKKHLPNDERPFPCSECDKAFFEKSHLQRHQFFHSEVRPYRCESCGKCYKTERCLKVHSAVHSADRPFVCPECNKGFLSSSKLRQHANIHSGLRPFVCKYCARDFTNFPNWLKHIRRRHKVDHRTGEKLESVPKFMTKKKTAVESVPAKKTSKKLKDPPPPLSSIKEESLPFVGDNSNIDLNLVSKDDLLPPLKMEEMGDIFLSLPEGVVNEDARDGTSPEKDRRTTAPAAEEEGERKEESLPEPPLGLGAGDDGVLFRFGYGDVVDDDDDGRAEFDCDFAANEAASVIRESEANGAGSSDLRSSSTPPLSAPTSPPDQQQHQILSHTILSGGGGSGVGGLSIFPTLISICGGVGADHQQQFQLINPHFLHLPPQLLRRNGAGSGTTPPEVSQSPPDGTVGMKLESP